MASTGVPPPPPPPPPVVQLETPQDQVTSVPAPSLPPGTHANLSGVVPPPPVVGQQLQQPQHTLPPPPVGGGPPSYDSQQAPPRGQPVHANDNIVLARDSQPPLPGFKNSTGTPVQRSYTVRVGSVGADPGFDFWAPPSPTDKLYLVKTTPGLPMALAGVAPGQFIRFNGVDVVDQMSLAAAVRGWVESRNLDLHLELLHDPSVLLPDDGNSGIDDGAEDIDSELPFDPDTLSPNAETFMINKNPGESLLGMQVHTYGGADEPSPVYLVGADHNTPFSRADLFTGQIMSVGGYPLQCKTDLIRAVAAVAHMPSFPVEVRMPQQHDPRGAAAFGRGGGDPHGAEGLVYTVTRGSANEKLGVDYIASPDGVFTDRYDSTSPFARAGMPLGQLLEIDGIPIDTTDDIRTAKKNLDAEGKLTFQVIIDPCDPPRVSPPPQPAMRTSRSSAPIEPEPGATQVERLAAELKNLATKRRKGAISNEVYQRLKEGILKILREQQVREGGPDYTGEAEPIARDRSSPPAGAATVNSIRKVLLRESPQAGSTFVKGPGVHGVVRAFHVVSPGWVFVRGTTEPPQEGYIREAHLTWDVEGEAAGAVHRKRPSRRGSKVSGVAGQPDTLNGLLDTVLTEIRRSNAGAGSVGYAKDVLTEDGLVTLDEHFDPITGTWKPTYVRSQPPSSGRYYSQTTDQPFSPVKSFRTAIADDIF